MTFEGDVPERVQRFSRVLLSVGRRPNSAGLGLEKTEVEIDAQGFIIVDLQRRTADPHILAIGDVAGQPMLAHKASHEGKVGRRGVAGKAVAFKPQAIPAVVFTDPEVAWAGLTETEAKARSVAIEVAQFPWAASGRAQAIGRTEGLTKWIIDPQSQRLLGCGIVGWGGRPGERGRPGDRNGLHGHDLARNDSSPSDPQRNARRRGRGASGVGRQISIGQNEKHNRPSGRDGEQKRRRMKDELAVSAHPASFIRSVIPLVCACLALTVSA